MIDFQVLKDFLDLGGVFIITILMIYNFAQRFEKIEKKLDKTIILIIHLLNLAGDKNILSEILDNGEYEEIKKRLDKK